MPELIPGAGPLVNLLLGYGPLGVMCIAEGYWIWRQEARIRELSAQNDELQDRSVGRAEKYAEKLLEVVSVRRDP